MSSLKRNLTILLVVLAVMSVAPRITQAKTWKEWICAALGIDPKVYDKLSHPRGPADLTPGASIVKLDLQTGQEQVLWNCEGCWSPVMLNSTDIALLRRNAASGKNEIWIISSTDSPRLAFAGEGIDMLVGRVKAHASHLLILQTNRTCVLDDKHSTDKYSIKEIDLASANPVLNGRDDVPTKCVGLGQFKKPDSANNNHIVDTSVAMINDQGQTQARTLKMATIPQDNGDPVYALLAPQLDKNFERFDPILFSDSVVVYIRNPWP